MKPNLVFFGSPEFSATILESLIKLNTINVVGVVTTPDKPSGRNLSLLPSPVALISGKYNLPVYKPHQLDEANLAHLKLLKPDIFLIVSFGKMIPETYIKTPTIGIFNIHFSLLPKYRGALCISEAIKNQDEITGVTLLEMDNLLDHGPIISQAKITVDINDNVATLTKKLTQTAIVLLADKLPEICAGNYSKTAQDETKVVFTPSHKTLNRESAFISFNKILAAQNGSDAKKVHATIRSLNPDPGAWTTIDGTNVKIISTSLVDNKLILNRIQLSGKSPISWKQYLSGHPLP